MKLKPLYNYITLSSMTFLAFILPGVLFSIVNDFYHFRFEILFLLAFVPAALIFPLVKPRGLSIAIFVLFAIMELIQFSHLFYFHTPLSVFSIHLMVLEYKEVIDSMPMTLPWGLYHVVAIIAVYGGLIFAYCKIQSPKSYIGSILIIIMLGILPYKALFKTPNINNFMPSSDSISIYNDLRVFSAYFFIYLKRDKKHIANYPPYIIDYKDNKKVNQNIVLILGESVNANHIGLIGYKRNTTPLLQELAREDSNFVYQKGISSSVLTRVSLPMFMNIAYKYDDIKHILSQESHLLKLAKAAGYKTFYFSNQTEAEATAMATNYIDVIYTKEKYYLDSEKLGDLILLKKLDEYMKNFESGKNFIILHQRNTHSPYEKGYKNRYDKANVFALEEVSMNDYRINSYDNAMIFNDYIISSIFRRFKELNSIESYIIFVPDHGEAMGEFAYDFNVEFKDTFANNFTHRDKVTNIGAISQSQISGSQTQKKAMLDSKMEFGHSFLSHNVANIPIFASMYNTDNKDFTNTIHKTPYITHYELGVNIAKLMGFSIHNPIFKEGVFYINGTDIAGNAGFIEVQRHINANDYKVNFIYHR